MAIVLHPNIKVFDVNRYLNVKQMKPAFERLPIYARNASHSIQFHKSNDIMKKSHQVYDRKMDPYIHNQFVDRSLQLFSEIARIPNGAVVIMTLKRIFPGDKFDEEWEKLDVPTGVLCVEKENMYGGLDQFKMLPNIHYSEIDYEMSQGYLMSYDSIHHKTTPISNNYKDVIIYKSIFYS